MCMHMPYNNAPPALHALPAGPAPQAVIFRVYVQLEKQKEADAAKLAEAAATAATATTAGGSAAGSGAAPSPTRATKSRRNA